MPRNAEDPVLLKNLLKEAESRLHDELGKRPAQSALDNLRRAADSVDHDQNMEGLAIFANENLETVLKTRFPLPARVVIDERFALGAVLRAERRSEPYAVLVLSLKQGRLFEGIREDLTELRGDGFPAANSGAGGGSKVPGGIGVNPTATVDSSRAAFVRECVKRCASYPGIPHQLVVTGTEEVLAEALAAIPASFRIVASVGGNRETENPAALGKLAWEAIREARRESAGEVLNRLEEARSAQRYEAGIQAVSALAHQGRVELLVCAMDFEAAGRFDETIGSLTLIDAPQNWRDIDDAVEWTVQRVLDSGGTVRFVEGDLLTGDPVQAVVRY